MLAVRPLRSWLIASHLGVLLLPVLVFVGTGALAKNLILQTQGELLNQGALVALLLEARLQDAREEAPELHLEDLGEQVDHDLLRAREATLAAYRLLDPWGVVVATSGSELGEDLSHQPEVRKALDGSPGSVTRPRADPSKRQPLRSQSRRSKVRLFVAVPVVIDGELEGVVLMSRTPMEEVQALYAMAPRLWLGSLFALALTIGLAVQSGRTFSRSSKRLAATSHRIADGSLAAVAELQQVDASHVAEVRELSAAVATMTRRLQERLAYISEFAGNVSHEFKTPISTLRGTVELLRDDEQMPSDQRARFLSNAMEELDRLERLVSGLLALARAEEGGESRPIELAELVAEVAERHPVQVEGLPGRVLGDRTQLGAVLENLVENGFQHGGDEVRVRGWREGARTGFDVVDNGPGISPANRERIFDRFFTTDREGNGTGLGLALARTVCRVHGGEITVESRAGETCFRVALPVG